MRVVLPSRMVGGSWLIAAAVLGCQPDPPPAAAPHFVVADAILSVSNRTVRQLEVSLESGAGPRGLGSVQGQSSRSFSLPSGLPDSAGGFKLEAHDARGGFRSTPFALSPGQRVVWTIDTNGNGAVVRQ